KAILCAADGGSDKARLVAENGRVWSLAQLGHYSDALARAGEVAALAKALGDVSEEAIAGCYAAYSLSSLGRHEEAVEQAERAAMLANGAGEVGAEAGARRPAAYSLVMLGRHEKAVEQAERAATLARDADDMRGEAEARRLVVCSLGALGRHAEAVAQAELAAMLAKEVGDMGEEAVARRHAAFSLGELRRHEEAVEQAERAAMLAKEVGDMGEESEARRHAAFSSSALGRHSQAILEAERSAMLLDKFGTARAASGLDTGLVAQYLVNDAGKIGGLAARALCREATESAAADFAASLHSLFAPVSQPELGEIGTRVLDAWLVGFVAAALRVESSPDRLTTLAEAIAIHFPDRIPAQRQRLADAAAYHRSGRSHAALERLDPDFANALAIMHPPRDEASEKKPRQRAKAAKAKR
ncbi:MAG: hypothetical protein ACLPN5_11945, partial [Roseiarcus sp.]